MDSLKGKILINSDNVISKAEDLLKETEVIGYYFSAHWCPPCQRFTPILKDFHEELKKFKHEFEIVFISSDRNPEEMQTYMKKCHGCWYALPWNDPVINCLKVKYNIQGIPSLVIVKKDGRIVTKEGRSDVQKIGPQIFKIWKN